MIKLALLFLITGGALVVAVTLIVGMAWLAIAVPVVLVTGTGYGALVLTRRWERSSLGGNHPADALRVDREHTQNH
jgi:hypothetical protein